MIDFMPPQEHRVIVDDNSDYLMFIDKKTIRTEDFITDNVLKSYKSAWVYVTYYRPYSPYVLSGKPPTPIAINKYKTIVNCQTYQSVLYEMHTYDINGNLIESTQDYLDNKIPSIDFRPIRKKSIGAIQANIICGTKKI